MTSEDFVAPRESDAAAIRRNLSTWFEENARDLPWRRTRDPYAIWVSEAMLQQTRVEVVQDYWPRFLDAFPTAEALARADEEAVLEAWSGLGYYRRARSLQAAARVIAAEHDGAFPLELDAALALPGVGPYTAGAVLSIAADKPVPLVDGNVERVFARLFAIDGVRGSGPLQRASWAAARFFIARDSDDVAPRVWNQALMELGALVCTSRSPSCGTCPLTDHCRARSAGLASALPRPQPKRVPLDVELKIFAARRGDAWLMTRRPPGGLMPGLWEFPTIEISGPELFPRKLESLGFDEVRTLFEIRHGITKHRIRAAVVCSALVSDPGTDGVRWANARDLESLALTGMARKVARRLDSGVETLFGTT